MLCDTEIILFLSIVTEDSGKTIIFYVLFTIVMLLVDIFARPALLNAIYENSIFYQFSSVFNYTMTDGEVLMSIVIALMTMIIVCICGIAIFNKKELK